MGASKPELSALLSGGISLNSITTSLVLIGDIMSNSSTKVVKVAFEFIYALLKHLSNESAKQYVKI